MKKVYVTDKEGIEALRKVSAITMEALEEDSAEDFAKWAVELGAAKSVDDITAHVISGSTMNQAYGLTGGNAYPKDCTIVSLTGVNTSKLAIPRFQVGARWMSDIVDNNLRRENAC